MLRQRHGAAQDRALRSIFAGLLGRSQPSPDRFPSAAGGQDFKPLADYVHGRGLKFGIHIMRGVPRQAYHDKTPIKETRCTAADIGESQGESGFRFEDEMMRGRRRVRDLWADEDLGACDNGLARSLPAHGAGLYLLTEA